MSHTITLTSAEANLIRQWYNAVVDLNPTYLADGDHELGKKITEAAGGRWSPPRVKDAAP
ncbi:MAG: hypothetical protein Q7T61_00820 [Caulobacter sp.]|nr:hypothetical protein [Caulobacter sp.]